MNWIHAAGLSLLAFELEACRADERLTTAPSIPDSADMVGIGLTQNLTDGGVLKATLVADSVMVYEPSGRFEYRNIRVTFLAQDGMPASVLTALRGTYWIQTNRLLASGTVSMVRSTDGARLRTDSVLFDPVRNELITMHSWVLDNDSRRQPGSAAAEPRPNTRRLAPN